MLLMLCFSFISMGQNKDVPIEQLPLKVRITFDKLGPIDEVVYQEAIAKMDEGLKLAGLSAEGTYSQLVFFITGKLLNSNVGIAANSSYVLNYKLTYGLMDLALNQVIKFDSRTVEVEARNETFAYSAMVENFAADRDEMINMIQEAKNLLMTEYETNCQVVIEKTNELKSRNQEMEALAFMRCAPIFSPNCSDMLKQNATMIYQEYTTKECPVITDRVKNAVSNNHDDLILTEVRNLAYLGSCSENEKEVEALLQAKKKDQAIAELKKIQKAVKAEEKLDYPLDPKIQRISVISVEMSRMVEMQDIEKINELVPR